MSNAPSSQGGIQPPARRPLRIFSNDPLTPVDVTSIEVENEKLQPGPVGDRLEIIDYDGGQKTHYEAVDLEDPKVLIQGGLHPTELDPRFHQQMVYAVAMRVLESFDHALGRRLNLGHGSRQRLRIFPHAFHGTNAYFSPDMGAVLFGYFRASQDRPGKNLPGQMVFTCLSHDIIAHELTHAIVYRFRPLFSEATNVDVLAFHEAFSDIVALMQHFSYKEPLRQHIQERRTKLRDAELLVGLAHQFGQATGMGRALRRAIENTDTPIQLTEGVREPHARGSILVAAVFEAFFNVYQARIRDLIRIATGGTGNLPDADLHPDLVRRVAHEASKSARSILTMCIRALDYLPPVDVTYGDFLRALVTADIEVVSRDRLDQRTMLIEAFRRRGIYPKGTGSLAQDSLVQPGPRKHLQLPRRILQMLSVDTIPVSETPRTSKSRSFGDSPFRQMSLETDEAAQDRRGLRSGLARELHAFAKANASTLKLDPGRSIRVQGFHPAYRVAPNGQPVIELVAQFTQSDSSHMDALGGVPFRGGTTIIAGADGKVRYVISKPIKEPGGRASAKKPESRLKVQRDYLKEMDLRDPFSAWADAAYWGKRTKLRSQFRLLCGGHTQ